MRVKKIARARTSLRLLPHQYVWGNPIDILLPMRLRNDLSFSKIAIFSLRKKKTVKFPHSLILQKVFSSWIEKTMTKTIRCHWENRFVPYGNVLCLSLFSLSKNWMHHVGWGCTEILPEMKLFTFRCVNTEASADCNDYSKTSLNSFFPSDPHRRWSR